MDFDLSDEQRQRVAATLAFVRKMRGGERFDRERWDEAARFGMTGLLVPEEWGGSGLDALDTILTIEAFGKGCEDGGLLFSLCAHLFACVVPVWRCGSKEQRERYLRGLAAGRLVGANAITEPESGSDVHAMRATARRDGDGYMLQGSKCFVTNAPIADLFVVYAMTDPTRKMFGISTFLLPKDAPGLRVGEGHPKVGLRGSPWGEVYFDECRVPESARLGPEGAGASIFRESMTWERACLFAAYVGAMERTLERCVDHARHRVQFGQAIGKNQSISNRIVDMKLRLETSRLLLYRAGWLLREGRRCDDAIALSKLWISESAVQSGLDAVQIFGGSGVVSDTGVDALLRDALPARIFSGTSEMQREILARHLGLR